MASASADNEILEGTYLGPGRICPRFRLPGGETISLSGDVPKVEENSLLRLTGGWRERSKCMQGREFRVLAFEHIQ